MGIKRKLGLAAASIGLIGIAAVNANTTPKPGPPKASNTIVQPVQVPPLPPHVTTPEPITTPQAVPVSEPAPAPKKAANCPITTCNDGSCSSSTGRGTCSHHDGVRSYN
jgi:hypothetical protein